MKQLINRFSYENLRNEAHVQLHENFVALVDNYKAEEVGIKALYEQYLPLFEKEKSVLDMIIKSGLTDEILAQDHLRDSLFRGLVDNVKSALHHYDDMKRRAAEKIHFVLANYGNIAAKPLDQESAAIEDLARELRDSRYSPFMDTLGLTDWLARLVEANEIFNNMMQARYSETAKRPTVNMRASREAVDKLFRAMLDLLDALAVVNGADKNAAFIAELNAITQRFEHILAQQKGKRDAAPQPPKGE